jgi:hypothetical protein
VVGESRDGLEGARLPWKVGGALGAVRK